MLEKTLGNPLDSKKIKSVNPKGNQPWIFTGSTDAKAEAPILWLPDAKSWLIGKDPDAGEDWSQEEEGTTEDEMIGWHHRLNRHEFEQAPGDGDGQGSLECCSPWIRKESDTTKQLINNNRVSGLKYWFLVGKWAWPWPWDVTQQLKWKHSQCLHQPERWSYSKGF